jgi:putative Holliday junction resolvase
MSLPNKGKILALDLGKRYTGVAVSDPSQRVVFPREEIEERDAEKLVARINELIADENIQAVVVGLPTNAVSEETKQSKWVRSIVEQLETPVELVDETYSSVGLIEKSSGRNDSLVAQKFLEKVLDL